VAATRLSPAFQLWRLVNLVFVPALLVGGVAAVAGKRWGAYLLLADVILRIGSHLAAGVWAYHDVMSRPWPEVPALTDSEWDD
jgi:hypothetical protein